MNGGTNIVKEAGQSQLFGSSPAADGLSGFKDTDVETGPCQLNGSTQTVRA
jgi:hypothetical protein